ncbi:MAG: BrxA/BrxB family bacilliredoxin [Saprospiraceae bacterium]|nr:BrxA/BrxB family bacilliredoxin [Saprospiraceae bacterium]
MYPEHLTAPMAKDLTDFGFTGLKSANDVHDVLSKKEGTVLMVVNSVCGCAAGNARPGVKMATSAKDAKRPDVLATVFAGVDKDATNTAREYMLPYPPSSPSIALFKDGELVHFIERHHIEGRPAQAIAENLVMAFNKYC